MAASAGSGSDLQQVFSERDGDGFGAVGGAELCEDDLDVFLDAVDADAEVVGDFLVRESLGDRAHDFRLPGRELLGRRIERELTPHFL